MKLEIELSDRKEQLQVKIIHHLLKDAYWCKGIPESTVQVAIDASICFGAYVSGKQIAFARVVTDQATFAWICDVIVDPEFRGQGISKKLIQRILDDSRLKGLRRICLATKDAHKLYEKYGFKVTETPQNWMEIKDNHIYDRKG